METLLTDSEAVFLTRAFDDLDPGRQQWAQGQLTRWKQAREVKRGEQVRSVESRFLDPREDFLASLPERERANEEWSANFRGEQDAIRADNRAFLQTVAGRNDYHSALAEVGRGYLGIRGELNEQTFHAAAKAKLQQGRERRAYAEGAAMAGAQSAYLRQSPAQALASFYKQDAQPLDLQGMSYLLGSFEAGRKAAQRAIEPYRDIIEDVGFGLVAGEFGEDGERGRPDINAQAKKLTEALYGPEGIDPETRAHVLNAVASVAAIISENKEGDAARGEGQAGRYYRNLLEQTDRFLEDMGQAADLAPSAHLARGAQILIDALRGAGVSEGEPTSVAEYALDAVVENRRLAGDLRRLRDGADPVRPVYGGIAGAVERGAYAAPSTLGYSALATNPVGFGYVLNSIADQNAAELRAENPDMPENWVAGVSGVSAVAETLIDKFEGAALVKHFPRTTGLLARLRRGKSAAGTAAAYAGAIGLYEFGLETGQEFVLPLTQEIAAAMTEDVPGVDWESKIGEVMSAEASVERLVALLPLVAAGGARLSLRDARARAVAGEIDAPGYLERQGVNPEQAEAIRAETDPVKKLEAVQRAKLSPEPAVEPEGASEITRDPETGGWQVETPAGPAKVATYGDAVALREAAAETAEDSLADATREYVGFLQGRGVNVEMTDQEIVVEDRIAENAEEADAYRARVLREQEVSGVKIDPLKARVLGVNRLEEARPREWRATSEIMRGANVLTVVEEVSEGDIKEAMARGEVTPEQVHGMLRNWEQVSGDDLKLGDATDTANLVEAWSDMVAAYAVTKRRDQRNQAKGFSEQVKAVLLGYREFFNHVIRRAAKLRNAKREGNLDETLEQMLDRSLGWDQARQEAREVARAAGAEFGAGTVKDSLTAGDASMSIAPEDYIERIGKRLDPILEKGDRRAKYLEGVQDRLAAFGDRWRMAAEDFEGFKKQLAEVDNAISTDDVAKALDLQLKDAAAALRTLKAMQFGLPYEVRAKVGGEAKLVLAKTLKGRAAEILRRVERMEKLIEEHLQKYYREQIVKLTKPLAKGKTNIPKGRGAEFEQIRMAAAHAITLQGDEAIAEVMGRGEAIMDAKEAGADTTADQEILEVYASLVNFGTLTADQLAAAHEMLESYLGEARRKWEEAEQARRLEEDAARSRLIESAGGGATSFGARAGKGREKLSSRSASTAFDMLQDFEFAFNGDARATEAVREVRRRHLKYEREVFAVRAGVTEHAKSASGSKSTRKAEKWLENHIYVQETMTRHWHGEGSEHHHAEEVTMTRDEALQEWLAIEQYEGQPFLEEMGYTPEIKRQLEEFIGEKGLEYGRQLRENLRVMHPRIDKVFRSLRGAPFPQVTKYFPAPRDVNVREYTEMENPMGAVANLRAALPGSLNSRIANKKAFKIKGATEVYVGHNREILYYVHMAEHARYMRRVFGDKATFNALDAHKGDTVRERISQWLDMVEQGGAASAVFASWQARAVAYLYRNWAIGLLSMRISSTAIQVTNAMNFLFKMNTRDSLSGLASLARPGNFKRAYSAVLAGDVIRQRVEQGANPDIRYAMAARGKPHTRSGKKGRARWELRRADNVAQRFAESGMKFLSLVDAWSIAFSGAVKYEATRKKLIAQRMDAGRAREFARAQAEEMLAEVAQPNSVFHRSISENTADSAWKFFLLAFISDRRRKTAHILAAKGAKATAKALATLWAIETAEFLIRGTVRVLAGDDEPEEAFAPEHWVSQLALSPFTGVPLFGNIVEAFVRMRLGEHVWSRNNVTEIGTNLSKFADDVPEGVGALTEGDLETALDELSRGTQRLGALYGPAAAAGNIGQQVFGFLELLQGELGDDDE